MYIIYNVINIMFNKSYVTLTTSPYFNYILLYMQFIEYLHLSYAYLVCVYFCLLS